MAHIALPEGFTGYHGWVRVSSGDGEANARVGGHPFARAEQSGAR